MKSFKMIHQKIKPTSHHFHIPAQFNRGNFNRYCKTTPASKLNEIITQRLYPRLKNWTIRGAFTRGDVGVDKGEQKTM